jgi:hypothetical protein
MSSYQRLSIQEKRALDLARMREQPVACPGCGVGIMPADLLAHLEQRCQGPAEPGPSAKWVTWGQALALVGVTAMRLSRWVRAGYVRMRGPRGDREYLLRDLHLRLAYQRAARRR